MVVGISFSGKGKDNLSTRTLTNIIVLACHSWRHLDVGVPHTGVVIITLGDAVVDNWSGYCGIDVAIGWEGGKVKLVVVLGVLRHTLYLNDRVCREGIACWDILWVNGRVEGDTEETEEPFIEFVSDGSILTITVPSGPEEIVAHQSVVVLAADELTRYFGLDVRTKVASVCRAPHELTAWWVHHSEDQCTSVI